MPITMEELKKGIALANIKLVVIRTASRHYLMKTASEAGLKPRVSAGTENELRKGDVILSQYITHDIIKGYDLELTDVLLYPKVLALVDGGVSIFDAQEDFESYTAPALGEVTEREALGVDIYCGNLDTGGNPVDYMKYSLDGCLGKPCEFTFKDGEFYAPKYTMISTPPFGMAPLSIAKITVSELPAAPVNP